MKRTLWLILFMACVAGLMAGFHPDRKLMMEQMALVNERFMSRHPVAGDSIRANQHVRPSNIWTRSVYMEGLLALNEVNPQPRYVEYATDWAEANSWGFPKSPHTRNADNQCCAQVYVELYRLHGDARVLGNTERMLNNVVNSAKRSDWSWIDALQMAMPVYAKMGAIKRDIRYFRTMKELYVHTRDCIGQVGLYNKVEGLWWRDAGFVPPYKEPNGKNCYWSRGNGWVMAALVRTLDETEQAEGLFGGDERQEIAGIRNLLREDFLSLALSVRKCQRDDGFWNCSLTDEFHYGGPESTGTALFLYGMAWGMRKGLLSVEAFGEPASRAWNALMRKAVHPDGFLGYVQGTGKEPKDSQPVGYDSRPDYEDFAIGCYLLAGSEMIKFLDAMK